MNGWTPIKLLNAAAWMLLPLAALLMSPFCIVIALHAGQSWLQLGLFDPAAGGDPTILGTALASSRGGFILGMLLASVWLLWRLGWLVLAWRNGASDELHPSGEWVQVAFGLLLAVPFFLLKTAPVPTWTSYTPQGGAGPPTSTAEDSCLLLLVLGLLYLVTAACAFLLGRVLGRSSRAATPPRAA